MQKYILLIIIIISPGMWRQVNTLHMKLTPPPLFNACNQPFVGIRMHSRTIQAVCAADIANVHDVQCRRKLCTIQTALGTAAKTLWTHIHLHLVILGNISHWLSVTLESEALLPTVRELQTLRREIAITTSPPPPSSSLQRTAKRLENWCCSP